ncbi:DUF6233 domain-containing protein [Streptomyces sp. NPDC090054]|uniref:DUF6233 domain-containing protein n=1 Tax=Streptomyces sp. NPDC090054 TaxID=3365933 RepID=UPI003800164F
MQVKGLQRTRDWITAEEQREGAEARRRPAAPPPEWLVEHGIGTGRPAVRVHSGDCWDTRSRCKPVDRKAARRTLAEGVQACPHCRPDTALGLLE